MSTWQQNYEKKLLASDGRRRKRFVIRDGFIFEEKSGKRLESFNGKPIREGLANWQSYLNTGLISPEKFSWARVKKRSRRKKHRILFGQALG
jgi:hypothetical protein